MKPAQTPPFLEGYFATSSVDEFSYKPREDDGKHQSNISYADTGRKTWKTLKERKEAVWPPYIEVALLEALEKYRPSSARDPKLLQRFPKRNRFISDFIFKATGKRRTPKQVGSRLQQLRDTCSEERVLKLLTRREPLERSSSSDMSERSESRQMLARKVKVDTELDNIVAPSPSPLVASPVSFYSADSSTLASPLPSPYLAPGFLSNLSFDTQPQTFVSIEFYTSELTDTSFSSRGVDHDLVISLDIDGSPNMRPSSASNLVTAPAHRIPVPVSGELMDCVPTITFSSRLALSPTEYHTFFCVFLEDVHIHSEVADIVQLSCPSTSDGLYIYALKLLPQYWSTLCQTADLSKITIAQDIMKVPVVTNEVVSASNIQDAIAFSVIYNFKIMTELKGTPLVPESLQNLSVIQEELRPSPLHDMTMYYDGKRDMSFENDDMNVSSWLNNTWTNGCYVPYQIESTGTCFGPFRQIF